MATGISDAIEVQTGTLGGSLSAKLAAALSSLQVKPSSFTLAVNTIQAQASQQLQVLGHLIDGKTVLDLTSTAEGTTYTSSELTICNLGAPDGNVFAGNNGFSAQAMGTVTTFSPTPLSFVSIQGFANGVDVNGNYAYVAAGSAGLQVVNISNRPNPAIVGSLSLAGNSNDVRLPGNFAYVAGGGHYGAGAGVLPKVVSEQLGHASTAFALDTYAHVLPHMQDEAAIRRRFFLAFIATASTPGWAKLVVRAVHSRLKVFATRIRECGPLSRSCAARPAHLAR
jgi:LVIVD repeat